MSELINLQNYWWLLISILGGVLVVLLFVQGGQSMLLCTRNQAHKDLMISILGRKWELSFTTLVVFGGAFFASFPLFYSTSFGGAYWLWMLILFSFILQAVSYEFRAKDGNLLGTKTYDIFLLINGLLGCVLLGVAVGGFFFGSPFTVTMGNILSGEQPVISQWAPTHGLEAICNWKCLLLGVMVFFLARTNGCLYFMNNEPDNKEFFESNRSNLKANAIIFVVLFLIFAATLLTSTGLQAAEGSNSLSLHNDFTEVAAKYFHNYLQLWWAAACLLIGVVCVLYAIGRSLFAKHFTGGIWWSGLGTFLVVISLFFVAGYADTAYYPSSIDPACSLTIRNSSSSLFTLKVMTYVSFVIPVVIAYIAYVWRSMEKGVRKP
jgi:cytochrome d ubiquinol oxidase subunit II